METLRLNNKQFNNNVGIRSEVLLPDLDEVAVEALSKRLAEELRKARKFHFAGGEVLLPADLTRILARDVVALAETEPCGLRGCTIFLNFENEVECRRLSIIDVDPSSPDTFELYLTLKESASWNHFLPQFLKKMTRSGTVIISPEYHLEKRKLYRSFSDY